MPVAPTVDRLLGAVLDGARAARALEPELRDWLAASPRFRSLVEANQDKLRKKLRTAGDAEAALDVRAELVTMYLLCAERRFDLALEAYGSGVRGPDLTITFRATQRINLEVTRLRAPLANQDRLARVVLQKLRQLRPSVPNALLVVAAAPSPLSGSAGSDDDAGAATAGACVVGAIRLLKTHAERKDDPFLARYGLTGVQEFFPLFLRLSGVYALAGPHGALWINKEGRHPLPPAAASGLLARLSVP